MSKEEHVVTKFVCDFCGKNYTKTVCPKTEGIVNPFPYDLNWVYVYDFKWKVSAFRQNEFKDKHFCSLSCMLSFTTKNVTESQRDE